MSLGASVRPHLEKLHGQPEARELPCRFRAGQPGATDANAVGQWFPCNLNRVTALLVAATARAAGALGHLLEKNRILAIRTGTRYWAIPRSEFAFGITIAAVKELSPARLPLFKVSFLTFRTLETEIHRLF